MYSLPLQKKETIVSSYQIKAGIKETLISRGCGVLLAGTSEEEPMIQYPASSPSCNDAPGLDLLYA